MTAADTATQAADTILKVGVVVADHCSRHSNQGSRDNPQGKGEGICSWRWG
jgi:hypothetical protein